MRIGRRLYFDILTGQVIQDTGESNDNVVQTTIEQDIFTFTALSERNRETFDVIELEYGQYYQDFIESISFRVNPATKELEFRYPDPNEPEEPQPYIKPLSETVNDQMDYLVDVDFRLSMVELGLI